MSLSKFYFFETFEMDILSLQEKIEIILIYGEARRSVSRAIRLYAERHPGERVPSRCSIYRIVQHFKTDGNVGTTKRNRRRIVTNAGGANEVNILAAVNVNPHVSTRELERESGISRSSILRILKQHKFHPYHIKLLQELHGDDFNRRLAFCNWARNKVMQNNEFFLSVLFTDECSFTNRGEVNRHNMHYWSKENPHWLREVEHQRQWSVNVWCGIMGGRIFGPFFFEGTLTGSRYANFLQQELPVLLENVPLVQRLQMWYQHDGCPAHYSQTARDILDVDFQGRWIGRGGPVHWPARSPDLTPLDFFLWGYLKDKVYRNVPTTRENMRERILDGCHSIPVELLLRTHDSFRRRIEKCVEMEGHQFEHLLH